MALYFFSGKGGVGKTHLSTSFAIWNSRRGRKTLLVEFSKTAQYPTFFEESISFTPTVWKENLSLSTWDGLDCLREYAGRILRSQSAADLFFKNKMLKNLIHLAPGLREIALLGKVTVDYRESAFKTDYEDIIVDAPSSGHFLSLLQSPLGLLSLVGKGPMKEQSESILKSLRERKDVFIVLVETASSLVQKETRETKEKIKKILNTNAQIKTLENLGSNFPETPAESWMNSAEKLSQSWEHFVW